MRWVRIQIYVAIDSNESDDEQKINKKMMAGSVTLIYFEILMKTKVALAMALTSHLYESRLIFPRQSHTRENCVSCG